MQHMVSSLFRSGCGGRIVHRLSKNSILMLVYLFCLNHDAQSEKHYIMKFVYMVIKLEKNANFIIVFLCNMREHGRLVKSIFIVTYLWII